MLCAIEIYSYNQYNDHKYDLLDSLKNSSQMSIYTRSRSRENILTAYHLSSIFDIDSARQWVIVYAAAGEVVAFTI